MSGAEQAAAGPEGAGGGPEPGDRQEKGFRGRKREDHALALIDELRGNLDDVPRVKRILLELGRFYDPVLGGAVVGLSEQKAIVEALGRGDEARALELIQERYDLYIRDRAHLGRRAED